MPFVEVPYSVALDTVSFCCNLESEFEVLLAVFLKNRDFYLGFLYYFPSIQRNCTGLSLILSYFAFPCC